MNFAYRKWAQLEAFNHEGRRVVVKCSIIQFLLSFWEGFIRTADVRRARTSTTVIFLNE